jgi:glutathione synthase/RimK-type ligase-like ATP-grasp enzyme
MKLGIIAKTKPFNRLKGTSLNSIKIIIDFLRKKREVVLIDWRDIDSDLNVSRYVICNEKRIFLKEEASNLNDLCEILFIKELGKIHNEKQRFLGFLSSLKKFKGKIVNPLQTIKNNLSKQYLLELKKKGFPVIPTLEINENATLKSLKKINFQDEYYKKIPKEMIVKPKIFGETGFAVRKLGSFKDEKEFKNYKKKNFPILMQPLIEEVLEKGENSFIFLDKKIIHSVNKFTGKFKVNYQKGIKYFLHEPTEKEIEICNKVIKNWPDLINYGRIDLISYEKTPLISEVEVINPSLYIEEVLSTKEKFVQELEALFLSLEK